MNPKHRIYSIPYNGTNPEWVLRETEKRKKHIDHAKTAIGVSCVTRYYPR